MKTYHPHSWLNTMVKVSGSLVAHLATIVVDFAVSVVAVVGSRERLNVVQGCGELDANVSVKFKRNCTSWVKYKRLARDILNTYNL